jgi:hypothetical protein
MEQQVAELPVEDRGDEDSRHANVWLDETCTSR